MKLRRLLRLAALVFLPLIAPGIHGVPMRDFVASATAPTIALPATDRISVSVTGQGPDVILIPGLASSAHVWDATVAHIAARNTMDSTNTAAHSRDACFIDLCSDSNRGHSR